MKAEPPIEGDEGTSPGSQDPCRIQTRQRHKNHAESNIPPTIQAVKSTSLERLDILAISFLGLTLSN